MRCSRRMVGTGRSSDCGGGSARNDGPAGTEPGAQAALPGLRGHGSGKNLQPVEVHAGSENSSEAHDPVDVNWTPRVISIELEQRSARHLLVQPIFNVQPPPGFSLNRARAVPNAAVVSGWE